MNHGGLVEKDEGNGGHQEIHYLFFFWIQIATHIDAAHLWRKERDIPQYLITRCGFFSSNEGIQNPQELKSSAKQHTQSWEVSNLLIQSSNPSTCKVF